MSFSFRSSHRWRLHHDDDDEIDSKSVVRTSTVLPSTFFSFRSSHRWQFDEDDDDEQVEDPMNRESTLFNKKNMTVFYRISMKRNRNQYPFDNLDYYFEIIDLNRITGE